MTRKKNKRSQLRRIMNKRMEGKKLEPGELKVLMDYAEKRANEQR